MMRHDLRNILRGSTLAFAIFASGGIAYGQSDRFD